MSTLALGTVVAMLALYAPALFFALQQVNDRYTTLLTRVLMRKVVVLLPLCMLLGLLVCACVLVLLSGTLLTTVFAVAVLLLSIVTTLWGAGAILMLVADGTKLIPLLYSTKQQEAFESVLWNAAGRADRRVAASLLKDVFSTTGKEKEALLDWLLYHRELLAKGWVARELLNALVADNLNALSLEQCTDVLCAMLQEALDAEDFPRARDIIEVTADALAHAAPWTDEHGYLLYRMGFVLWNNGTPGASDPRSARIPSQLADTQSTFIGRTNRIWSHVCALGDEKAADAYAGAICDLAEDVPNKDACESFLSRIFDIMADGFPQHILNRQTVSEIASSLGFMRSKGFEDEDFQRWIDRLVVTLGAMFVELPEDDNVDVTGQEDGQAEVIEVNVPAREGGRKPHVETDTTIAQLQHVLENGSLFLRLDSLRSTHTYRHDWLSPESYYTVAKALGLKKLG